MSLLNVNEIILNALFRMPVEIAFRFTGQHNLPLVHTKDRMVDYDDYLVDIFLTKKVFGYDILERIPEIEREFPERFEQLKEKIKNQL